ncbi:MAG TPA: hypothetical protein DIT03_07735, partial [Candidatus Accumulibacter sp.]|nr:hypothetical protein [Accumulibacter sp.]HCV13579.1 hypothetical protein [Accumulibacter sp.]
PGGVTRRGRLELLPTDRKAALAAPASGMGNDAGGEPGEGCPLTSATTVRASGVLDDWGDVRDSNP